MAIGDDIVIEGLNLCDGEDAPTDPTPTGLSTTGKLKETVSVKIEEDE